MDFKSNLTFNASTMLFTDIGQLFMTSDGIIEKWRIINNHDKRIKYCL